MCFGEMFVAIRGIYQIANFKLEVYPVDNDLMRCDGFNLILIPRLTNGRTVKSGFGRRIAIRSYRSPERVKPDN